MSETLSFSGALTAAHRGPITCLCTSTESQDLLLTGSRDKTLIVWSIASGEPRKILTGHNHFVSDLCVSLDGNFALSASWDKTLRLWELAKGTSTKIFVGHTADVLSVSFSADNRQIVSGARDRQIKVWNTLGECKFTMTEGGHQDWVSCVRFSPNPLNPVIVSAGWDKVVKVWDLHKMALKTDHFGHTGYISTLAVSPDGSLAASGGKDGVTMLWDLNDGKHLYSLEAGDIVNCLAFSPNRYWLCAATSEFIKVFDLESKIIVEELKPEPLDGGNKVPVCNSLTWSFDGRSLFAGYSDNVVRVYNVTEA